MLLDCCSAAEKRCFGVVYRVIESDGNGKANNVLFACAHTYEWQKQSEIVKELTQCAETSETSIFVFFFYFLLLLPLVLLVAQRCADRMSVCVWTFLLLNGKCLPARTPLRLDANGNRELCVSHISEVV